MRLPKKRLREVEAEIIALEQGYPIRAIFVNVVSGQQIMAGGLWDKIAKCYIPTSDSVRTYTQKLSDPQFTMLKYCYYAMNGNCQEVVCHGSRRAGKSVALFAAVFFVMLTRPGTMIFLVGLRKRHGTKIIAMIKRALPRQCWRFDGKDTKLTIANGAKLYAKAAKNADSDRGDGVSMLALDEAAFMNDSVHDALMPSILDKGGFVCMVSSPNGLNWFYKKAEQSTSPDKAKAKEVRTVHLTIADNVFDKGIAERAEKAKLILSWDAYQQEILGLFLPKHGLVFSRWKPDNILRGGLPASLDTDTSDIMTSALNLKGYDVKYLVGVDYNLGLNLGIICQINKHGYFYIVDTVKSEDGPQAFGEELMKWLKNKGMGPHNVLVVADASGNYQSPEMKQHLHSNQVLRAQEFLVVTPQTNQKTNPKILEKIEVMKALVSNAAGECRLFVLPEVEYVINMFKELNLDTKANKPNLSSPYIHCFDALSYPIWFVHGTGAFSEHFQIVQPVKERMK